MQAKILLNPSLPFIFACISCTSTTSWCRALNECARSSDICERAFDVSGNWDVVMSNRLTCSSRGGVQIGKVVVDDW